MFDRIAIVVAALLSLVACDPDGFVVEAAGDDLELAPVDVWSEATDDTTDDGDFGDEGGEAGGESGELLPDMGDGGETVPGWCCECGNHEGILLVCEPSEAEDCTAEGFAWCEPDQFGVSTLCDPICAGMD